VGWCGGASIEATRMHYRDGWLRVSRAKAVVKHNYVIIHTECKCGKEFKGYSELPTCVLKEISNILINKYFSNTGY